MSSLQEIIDNKPNLQLIFDDLQELYGGLNDDTPCTINVTKVLKCFGRIEKSGKDILSFFQYLSKITDGLKSETENGKLNSKISAFFKLLWFKIINRQITIEVDGVEHTYRLSDIINITKLK